MVSEGRLCFLFFFLEGVHRVHFHWPAITVNIPVNGLGVVKRIM